MTQHVIPRPHVEVGQTIVNPIPLSELREKEEESSDDDEEEGPKRGITEEAKTEDIQEDEEALNAVAEADPLSKEESGRIGGSLRCGEDHGRVEKMQSGKAEKSGKRL